MPRSKDDQKERRTGTSPLEWGVAVMGALILIGTIGYMAYYGLTQEDGPPKIALVQGIIEEAPDGYVMQFTAHNEGYSTAAAFQITGQLLAGEQVVEESEATIDYVPAQSEREGGLFFAQDPRQHRVVLQSEGYSTP